MSTFLRMLMLGALGAWPLACGPLERNERGSISSLMRQIDDSCGPADWCSMNFSAYLGSSSCGRLQLEVRRTPGVGYRISAQLRSDIEKDRVLEYAVVELDAQFRTQRIEFSSLFENVLIEMQQIQGDDSYLVEYRSDSEDSVLFTSALGAKCILPLRIYQALILAAQAESLPPEISIVCARGSVGSLKGGTRYVAGNLKCERFVFEQPAVPISIVIGRDSNGEAQSCCDCASGLAISRTGSSFESRLSPVEGGDAALEAATEFANLLSNSSGGNQVRLSERVSAFRDSTVTVDSATVLAKLRRWVAGLNEAGIAPINFNANWVLNAFEVVVDGNEVSFESRVFPSARFRRGFHDGLLLIAVEMPGE